MFQKLSRRTIVKGREMLEKKVGQKKGKKGARGKRGENVKPERERL